MTVPTPDYISLVRDIVTSAKKLNAANTDQPNALVNYACIFSHGEEEYTDLVADITESGRVIKDTQMGPVLLVPEFGTSAGPLHIVKVRKPDPTRPERGDADFTVTDYESFKAKYLGQPGWNIVVRPEMEMLELSTPDADVLAYYSHPTLSEVLGV